MLLFSGDIESMPFIEALRQLSFSLGMAGLPNFFCDFHLMFLLRYVLIRYSLHMLFSIVSFLYLFGCVSCGGRLEEHIINCYF